MSDSSSDSGGRLVLVATPIGNLDDLSTRAIEALRGADLVAAEDTRRTGRLLAHIEASPPQTSYHDHSDPDRVDEIVARIREGQTVVLVTDAGTPGVSDPGYRIVRACLDGGLPVEAVPGPSAVLHALVVSGLPTDRFAFDGFLPRKGSARGRRLTEIADEARTTVVFLSPHRAAVDLDDLAAACGADRGAALCRELTKMHEEVRRATLGELAAVTAEEGIRGEATLVIAGAPPAPTLGRSPDELAREVELRTAAGIDKKDAIAEVAADAGVPKRDVYQAVLDAGGSSRSSDGSGRS